MTYLLDTNWLLDYVGAKAAAIALVSELTAEEIALSVITLGEVYEGVFHKPLTNRQQVALDRMVTSSTLYAVDVKIAREYARVRAQLRSSGNLIPDNDLWIAATALAYNLTLVSRDPHFQRVQELRVYVL
ncbi:MAG: type II toxin-antitoxin system VapC family toxin [Chloroflexi bacterium]|nr:type II toxin-antitoxin system VapC family toxin [Chloroflexota bacterium]